MVGLPREWPEAQDMTGIVAATSSFDISMQIYNCKDLGYSVYFIGVCMSP